MGTQHAKSVAEMNRMNLAFWKKVKLANTGILRDLAKINKVHSIKEANTVRFTGALALISDIEISTEQIQVKTSQSSIGYAWEIERGLKDPEFRTYEEFPKLKAWVQEKFGNVPPGGITVGRSKGGIPHPKGLHFMESGFDLAFQFSDQVIRDRLRRLG